MWRKLTIDDRAEHYLKLQLEREKKEEKEDKNLEAMHIVYIYVRVF